MRLFLRSLLFVLPILAGTLLTHAQTGRVAGLDVLSGAIGAADALRWIDSFRNRTRQPALLIVASETAGPGMRVLQHLGGNYRLVLLDPVAAKGQAMPVLSAVFPLSPEMKIARELRGNATTGSRELLIAALPGTTTPELAAVVAGLGGKVHPGPLTSLGYFEATMPLAAVRMLAADTRVLHIGLKAEDKPLNNESRRTLKANVAAAPVVNGGWNLRGDSITIGVGDDVPGVFHVDTRDRIVNYNPRGYSNHGQHVNGTAGGAGIMDPRGEGFAPHALLVDHLYNLVWQNTGAMRSAHNMRITNNSYANVVGDCNVAGRYDVYSQVLDTIALQYPDVLHVFASGNDGSATCSPYPAGYGTVTGGYQVAKNVLVVGNSTKFNDAAGNTSRGPVRDGRLKPEITAVGTTTYSTRNNDTYLTASGTSMACPEISGSAALLQERYKQTHSGAYPSSALTKALLMNGAMDLGRRGPDYEFGFGVADLTRSLRMMDSSRFLSGVIANGAAQTPVSIAVPAGTGQLKVMLYWHDAPSSTLATTQLINDLDLSLSSPASTTLRPLVLNPNPANVKDTAAPGIDRLNNVEQVVVNNPAAGTYVVNVNGYSVPMGPQAYTVVWDIVPAGIELTCPLAGESFRNGDPVVVTWNASPGTNQFTVELSTNNGGTWTTLTSGAPANDRIYFWPPISGINSAQCRLRVSRNGTGEQSTSGLFTVSDQPVLVPDAVQCPGYVAMHWAPVPNATGYAVLRKIGPFLQTVQTLTDTSYTASGLTPDSLYYFAVQPMFGAVRGIRSLALRQRANAGSCAGTISDNDLRLEAVLSPVSGRLNTSSALSSSQTLQVAVRNLDDAAVASYQVAYQINGGSWTTQTLGSIAAGATVTVSFTGLNLAAPGTYVIRTAVTNLAAADPVPQNDTMSRTVRQLQNAAIALSPGFVEDFESAARLELQSDSMGFTANERWDFINSHDTGRLRSFVDSTITISGNRSVSLDLWRNMYASFNRLVGTFNLNGVVPASTEVRLEFDYKLHGRTRTADSNYVWVRGSDTQPWQRVFAYNQNGAPGAVNASGSLSLSDALNTASQTFSSSTQIAFGQFDTSVIANNEYGNGLTLDNIRLYSVANDAGITGVLSPTRVNCGLGASTPVTITVSNGIGTTLPLVYLYYQFNGGAVVKDSIQNLPGKTVVPFTFYQPVNASAPGSHTLRIWAVAAGDSYPANDSVLNYSFRNQPLITGFPYLQDFEGGDGYWFADGQNNSWRYGTPAGVRIHKAASGTKAWKTSLTGNYNDNERSYLYSPCFSIAGLGSPMLSFSMASEIEDCGNSTLCDGAWVEYSVNDTVWTKLGASGQGTNWYNSSSFQLWNSQNGTRWKVASIPLPTGITAPLRLRFVMYGDPGTSFEGLAIDDIHVFDRVNPLYTGGALGPVTQTLSSGGFTGFQSSGAVIARLDPGTGNPGSTDVNVYTHTNIINATSSQYFLPRSFVINTQNPPTDSVTTRLFIPDADVLTLVNATGCSHCSKPEDAYELGVTKYDNSNRSVENGSLSDNAGGVYEFIPYSRVRWVPYDAGYYAEFRVASFSELWFNTGGAGNAFPLPVSSVEFTARKISESSVLTSWLSHVDTQVSVYELQRSEDGVDFRTIARKASLRNNQYEYTYVDLLGQVSGRALYYRLRYTLDNGKSFFSPTRQIIWSGRRADLAVSPNPTPDGRLLFDWATQPGETLSIQITDVAGRVLHSITEIATGYSNRTPIDISAQPKGVYMVRATLNGEKFAFKVTRL